MNAVSFAGDLEQQMLYHPYRTLDADPPAVGLCFENVHLETDDKVRLHGWWMPAQSGHQTLLYFHGNGGNISHRLDRAQLYHQLGWNVLMIDYRGYGLSQGHPSEAGTYQDAAAAWNYLVQTRGLSAQSIVLYGESLGSAVALETALHHPAAGLILEAPFTSTVAMAKRLFPQWPVESMIKNRYENLVKVKNLHMPLLVFHSPADQTVPFTMGEAIYQAASEPKKFVRLSGSHLMAYRESSVQYQKALQSFLEQISLHK